MKKREILKAREFFKGWDKKKKLPVIHVVKETVGIAIANRLGIRTISIV